VEAIRQRVSEYYGGKVRRHGMTPRGVDWESEPMQQLRFVQLLKLFEDAPGPFSLADLGCGYGAMLSFLDERLPGACARYLGVDCSADMVKGARRLHGARGDATFGTDLTALGAADYCVASGVFNVKLDIQQDEWERYTETILASMSRHSRSGFAFNMMASWPGAASVPELYRSTPERWIGPCERLGGRVEVLRGYGMREFTLLVRKPAGAPPD